MLAPRNATDSRAAGTVTHQNAILAIICMSYVMVILDNSIIFTGLPRIRRHRRQPRSGRRGRSRRPDLLAGRFFLDVPIGRAEQTVERKPVAAVLELHR